MRKLLTEGHPHAPFPSDQEKWGGKEKVPGSPIPKSSLLPHPSRALPKTGHNELTRIYVVLPFVGPMSRVLCVVTTGPEEQLLIKLIKLIK